MEERIREIQKVYETEKKQKLTRAQAVEEIVANSVIPAFSDEKFSSNVAENNKTLAGKIREWIDEFINELKEIVSKLSKTKPEVKAVSKDIALMVNIRNIIDESLSRTGGIREAQGEIRESIVTLPDGKRYVQADEQVIKSDNPDNWESEIINYVNDKVRKGENVSIPLSDGSELLITGRTAWKLGYRNGQNEGKPISDKYYLVKGNAAGVIDEIAEVSTYDKTKPPMKQRQGSFAEKGFDYRYAFFRDLDGKYYRLDISVGINSDSKEVYNIGKIKEVPFPVSGSKAAKGMTPYSINISQENEAVNNIISQNAENYSLNQNENSDIRYSVNEEFSISKKEMEDNMQKVVNMQAVIRLSGEEFKKSETDLITQVTDYFNSLGGEVENSYLGTVSLTQKGVKSSLGHGIGRLKSIAFTSVPNVIENGEIIDYQENWKNRGYDTVVIAAPIKIAEEEYFVGVIVRRKTNEQDFYLHEVLAQKKEESSLFKTGAVKNGVSGNEPSSLISLLKKLQDVKNESEQTKHSINEPDMEAVAKEIETKKEEMKEIRRVSESSFEKLLTREDLKPTVYQKNALDLFLEADRKLSEINKNIEKLTGLRDKAETGKKAAEFEKDIAYWRREYAKWNSIYNERIAHSDVQALISKAVKLELADLINKYGSIKPGFNPKREISVPKKTSPNKKVRQTVRTILESGAITDEMIPEIEKDIIDEKFSYVPLSDDSAKKYAEEYLKKWEYEGGMQAWESTLRQNKRIGKNDIALCEYLLQQAAKDGNIKDVLKLSAELSAEGTRAGQTAQAISLLWLFLIDNIGRCDIIKSA